MPSQYKQIHGVKYERDLLEIADAAHGANRIMLKADAELLWRHAMDGNRVTATEERTLQYIMSYYRMNSAAVELLRMRIVDYHRMQQIKVQPKLVPKLAADTHQRPQEASVQEMHSEQAGRESYMGLIMNIRCILDVFNLFVKLCVRLASSLRP